ncbi:MAG: decarboxylating NADP(+)-dependent phosphogluconate dehydrogenase [Halieaceae bacterium]|nr:decarboxylating NADP(+)-dependent phosphogluconate dehydrogenase [Halieaceae bacterium]
MESTADIGLIGLAVMGQNLVLNMSDHGFRVAVFNRSVERTRTFIAGPAAGRDIYGCESLEELVARLRPPRRIMLMVRAGDVVDGFIDRLVELLDAGDIIIDGGNSLFTDSNRRCEALAAHGLHFVGCGVSGGEAGARHGPSIMPGGDVRAWPAIRDILQGIAARADGEPCCQWVGEAGAGHYVKMVHNGIEYGDMQLIGEAYDLLRRGLGHDADELAETFAGWNRGVLDSYLIEITADIFRARDADGSPLVDSILDAAGQKGTGKWTGINALDLGMPLTLISEAVFARCLSALLDSRQRAAAFLGGEHERFEGEHDALVADIHDALYASKIISYAQGFQLMAEAQRAYGWALDFGAVALMWRGGCIIRSRFLGNIRDAYADEPKLENLLLNGFFRDAIAGAEGGWRRTVARAVSAGLPVPAFSAALAWYDGYRSARLPANLLQAQRDYFGAHTFERVDRPRGEFFHHDWIGSGGNVSSGSYGA